MLSVEAVRKPSTGLKRNLIAGFVNVLLASKRSENPARD